MVAVERGSSRLRLRAFLPSPPFVSVPSADSPAQRLRGRDPRSGKHVITPSGRPTLRGPTHEPLSLLASRSRHRRRAARPGRTARLVTAPDRHAKPRRRRAPAGRSARYASGCWSVRSFRSGYLLTFTAGWRSKATFQTPLWFGKYRSFTPAQSSRNSSFRSASFL